MPIVAGDALVAAAAAVASFFCVPVPDVVDVAGAGAAFAISETSIHCFAWNSMYDGAFDWISASALAMPANG